MKTSHLKIKIYDINNIIMLPFGSMVFYLKCVEANSLRKDTQRCTIILKLFFSPIKIIIVSKNFGFNKSPDNNILNKVGNIGSN